jgi:STE24 endopeptidase
MNVAILIIFILYLGIKFFGCYLEYKNYSHLKVYGGKVPESFKDVIDEEKLIKIKKYTVEKIQIGLVNTAYTAIIIIIFIFGGLLDWYNKFIMGLGCSYYVSGILFFLLLFISYTFLEIPFDLYKTFKLEKKYEFNTMTGRLWLIDLIKNIILSVVIVSVLMFCILFTISQFQQTWWIWSWVVFFLFTMFIMYISPFVLEPLFNKFTPVEDGDLIDDLKELMVKIGIKVSKVLKMDASKRTKHTNAYFSGIGHVKRIVLFDTMMEKMNKDEITAVIAHEAGHWKKKHIIKNVIIFEIISFVFFFAAFKLMSTNSLLNLFNLTVWPSVDILNYSSIKLFLIYFMFGIVMFPVTPFMNFLTRKYERQADQFAVELVGTSKDLRSALIKLSADNLSNLYPHPAYEAFHYSHPSILKRLDYLLEMEKKLKNE